MPLLSFSNFGFQYNAQSKPTLYDINFSIEKGEKVLIAGPSGCGKSTLVHCINGLIPFSYKGEMTGSLTLNGKETKDMNLFEISAHVGTVLQDCDSQFVGLTVAEDIALPLKMTALQNPIFTTGFCLLQSLLILRIFLDMLPGIFPAARSSVFPLPV